jgi:hypothetical protein
MASAASDSDTEDFFREMINRPRRFRATATPTPRSAAPVPAPSTDPALAVDLSLAPASDPAPAIASDEAPSRAPAPLIDLTVDESVSDQSRILRTAGEDPSIGIGWALELFPTTRLIAAADASISQIDAERRRLDPCAFKIGATRDPHHRWHSERWGYVRLGWWSMQVLWETQPEEVRSLERRLIKHYRRQGLCRNVAPGGEGVGSKCCFVYCVFYPLVRSMRYAYAK